MVKCVFLDMQHATHLLNHPELTCSHLHRLLCQYLLQWGSMLLKRGLSSSTGFIPFFELSLTLARVLSSLHVILPVLLPSNFLVLLREFIPLSSSNFWYRIPSIRTTIEQAGKFLLVFFSGSMHPAYPKFQYWTTYIIF